MGILLKKLQQHAFLSSILAVSAIINGAIIHMSPTEAYLFLFADIFMEAIIFPIHGEVAFTAMKIFGGYNAVAMVLLSTIGGTIAMPLNWIFGRLALFASKFKPKSKLAEFTYNKMSKNGYLLMILAPIPIAGAIIALFSGFFRVSLIKMLIVSSITNLAFYSFALI